MEFILPTIHYMIIVIACLFMLLDIITGFIQATMNHELDSQVMKRGLFHKCGFILAIVFGCLCEYTMNYVDIGFTMPLQDAVCIYIITTEVISILENLAKISPELKESKFMEIFKRNEK